jgi:hypothetical protein
MKRAGVLTYITIALLVLFGLTDLSAELSGDGKGRFGETFSTALFHLEKGRWYIRAVVAVVMLLLGSHLTFGTQLIPGVA